MCKSYQMCCSFPSGQPYCFGADVVFVLSILFLSNMLYQEATILSIIANARRTREMVKIPERFIW